MEIHLQQEDITLFGSQVTTFPNGIKEAFSNLMSALGSKRGYYGISWFAKDGSISYYAMAPETFTGEAKQHNYDILILPKGEYFTETIADWMDKTDSIADVFHRLMADHRPHKNHPCIEWYKSDKEMLCMVMVKNK